MRAREIIQKKLIEVCGVDSVVVERPAESSRGDFASSVALVVAKSKERNPRELADEWTAILRSDSDLKKIVERIEVAGPGFVNFWLKDEYVYKQIALSKAVSEAFLGKKVLVDFSSPNIAKRFSVGHLRSTIIGQAICNLYKACGAEVTNDNHLGDWGTQFGMIISGVEEEGLDVSLMNVMELEELYVRFNARLVDKPELREKAKEAFLRLERGDENARRIWKQAVEVSMKEFEEIYKRLNVSFDHQYGESVYEDLMPEIIKQAMQTGVGVGGENGALIVKYERDGKEYMAPAMLQKSDGTTTYFTRDLATIRMRITEDDLKSDIYVYEVGGEQTLHFRQVFDAARKLWPDETKNVQFVHVAHGLLTLPEGKMSTRKGNTIKLEELLERAKDEAKDRSEGKYNEKQSEQMGVSAVKYNELKRSPNLDYVFVWDEALAMTGNSAPYINYAYVRAKKIVEGRSFEADNSQFEDEEKELARLLMKFFDGDVLEEAARNFAPQQVCAYLFEVAKSFNGFYDRNKVLGDGREKERLILVRAVSEVLRQGMEVLGISMVEKM